MLHLITHSNTRTFDRTSLDEESAYRRGLYLTAHNTHKRDKDSQAPGESRIHHLSKLGTGKQHLRLRGYRGRQTQSSGLKILNFLYFFPKALMEKIDIYYRIIAFEFIARYL
jgi:hypothetical protein